MSRAGSVVDRYRRLRLLGEGAAGQVWLVEDQLRPGSRLALKESSPDAPGPPDALRREFVTLSRLRHPSLVEVLDLDLSPADGRARFTQEFVEGEELTAAVGREGPDLLLEITAEALRALTFLHDFGFVHRDLKPANALVRRRPRLGCRFVLLDLGLAVADTSPPRETAGPAGTLPYMAPELFDGAPPSPRADLYSLGALLWEVVHGRPPHLLEGNDLERFVSAVREGRRSRPSLPDGYPNGLADWLEALLHPDPGARPSGGREALARLNEACGSSFPAETAANRAARLASDPPAGRKELGEQLRNLLAPETGPRVVWVAGPAGIGKSRLLRWLRADAVLDGWHVAATRSGAEPPEVEASSDGTVPLLEELRDRADRAPTLLLLDDLEAADGRLVRLVDRAAREGRAAPLQIVAALRPSEVTHPLLRRLLAHTGTVPTLRRLDVPPLGETGIRALAERATGSSELSEARLRWLHDASEGNPLLAEAALVEGVWEKRGPGRGSRVLERSALARMKLLSPPARAWLEALAVVGRDAPADVVAALAELEEVTAREAEEEVRFAGLALPYRAHWSVSSRTVGRQTLLQLSPEHRREMSLRAAELVERLDEPERSPWRLARLWSAAGDGKRAFENAVESARRATDEDDPSGAVQHYEYALRHCERRHPLRLELRIGQARGLAAAGLHRAAARAWGAARRLAREPADRIDVLNRQALALVHAGRFRRARAVAEEARELAERLDQPFQRALALRAEGLVLARLGRESDAIPLLDRALDVFRELGRGSEEAETLQVRAACKSRLQDEGAEADFTEALTLHRQLGQAGGELKCLLGLGVLHTRRGRYEEAGRLFEDVRRYSVERGNLDLQETALSKLASLAIEQGRLDSAVALSQEALDHARHLGDENRMTVDRCRLAESWIRCGRPAEAVDLLREGLERPSEEIEPDMVDYARLLLAQALHESPTGSDRDIDLLLEKSRRGFRQRHKTRPLLVALVFEMERTAAPGAGRFLPVAEELENLSRQFGQDLEPEIRVRAAMARASHLLGRGDPRGAAERAAEAVELASTSDLPSYAARAMALVGEAKERSGEREEAEDAFRQAGELLGRAAQRISDEETRESFLARPVYHSVTERSRRGPTASDRRLLALYEMIRALNSETDPDALLEDILDMALRAVAAERGMILLRDPAGEFSVRLARNLEDETAEDAERYSRSIVARAGAGRAVLALDAGEDARFRDLKSVSMYGIRSLMCVPLRSRQEIVGTVYLDSRREGTLFSRDDLRFIEAFADHAALALGNARERAELVDENQRLRTAAGSRTRFGELVGRSDPMQRVFHLIEKMAASDLSVLIHGESGTGKELVARALHFGSPRKNKIFLSENCAAIPEPLLESELFGHVKGAFTDASRDRTGLFEQAHGGTLFLDEIGDMSAAMQARLLRALQEGEVRRVGADRTIRVDVRVLAATHRDLATEVRAGRFREDLMYRLQVLVIGLPPLRERTGDIPLLIDHLLERISRERGRPAPNIDETVMAVLERHPWPGNVRELENTLQRLALLAGEGSISRELLAAEGSLGPFEEPTSEGEQRFSLDRGAAEQLRGALAAADGNRQRAARMLGISRATIYRKIKEFGLS